MTQIASLPNLTVEIAFTPTDLLSLTQTWTDCSLYVRDLNTRGGRQHFLDRMEASVLSLTFDNRTGFFMNGAVNGTGAIIGTRLPIRVKATWSGTTYTIFWGAIDTVDTSLSDALNSDLYISATDTTKFLSLRYLYNKALYSSVLGGSVRAWYNQAVNNSLPNLFSGAYNGKVNGLYELTDGVLLYDKTQAIDVTNGTNNTNTADVMFPAPADGSTEDNGVDFWIIGQALYNNTVLPLYVYNQVTAGTRACHITVNGSGQVSMTYQGTTVTSSNNVSDGYWHHIGAIITGNKVYIVVDGVASTGITLGANWTVFVGGTTSSVNDGWYHLANNSLAIVDQIVVSTLGVSLNDVKNRYVAGSLLRNDANAGDRIAQALVIAGRGSVSAGAIVVPNYNVNEVAYVAGSASNGSVYCQGNTSSLTSSTCLDTINQDSDTEIGIFFQGDDGTLNFHTRSWVYRPAGNAAPSGAYIWTDDTSSTYHYDAPSFQLTRDDVDVWTTVIVSPNNGTPQIYENVGNETRWGQSTLTKSTTGTTLDSAYQTAYYLGQVYTTPLARASTVKLLSSTDNGSNLPGMLGTNVQDRITIKRHPINASSAGTTSTDMSVESINHEFAADPGTWHTSFTLDPYPIRFSTQTSPKYFLVADDTTYGKSDLNTAL